ncbi:hypothetical protein DERF_006884 [Dermatophagoides farinae]|uniref:Uncharacterized protein n=1 Tax=Dermatophagoides farinae TaxID=6954 RepID=A0A922HZY8_DERFA|nr:hypothetical protein DERF_006884 [Dermatophagoides farinae]
MVNYGKLSTLRTKADIETTKRRLLFLSSSIQFGVYIQMLRLKKSGVDDAAHNCSKKGKTVMRPMMNQPMNDYYL